MPKTIREALKDAVAQLKDSHTAHLDAQVLLCFVLEVEKPYLIAHDDRLLTDAERLTYETLITRRVDGDPIAYLVGYKHFWDLQFVVSPAVLIPRPETEHLIEAALAWAKGKPSFVAADIGTGSGAIAVTIAKHTNATMHAVELSDEAYQIATKNIALNAVDVTLHKGSLASPLIANDIKVDLLMANLPYIETDELTSLEVTKHEPSLALDGGGDGLDLVRDLLLQVDDVCNENALIVLEIGMTQADAVREFAKAHLTMQSFDVIQDLAGLDRIIVIQL